MAVFKGFLSRINLWVLPVWAAVGGRKREGRWGLMCWYQGGGGGERGGRPGCPGGGGGKTSTWSSRLRTSSIELVLTRHEQAAAFMAATHGRLTGRPGVCISTLGPGALNFSTGAAYAHLGAMPMIMITGQKAIMTARQARFQIVDVIASMKPLTKMTRQIVSAASIPTIVREAFRVAMEERPGPVHLELPEDVAGEEVEPVPLVPRTRSTSRSPTRRRSTARPR